MSDKKPHIKLSDLPKRDPFEAPEGYFETLQSRIDARIDAGKPAKVIQVNWRYIGYAVAASVTLLIAVPVGGQFKSSQEPTVEQLLAEVSFEDCLAYLEETELELEIDEILQATSSETWSEPLVMPHPVDSGFQDEEDLDLLYERYGVTSDENLQTL